MALPHTSASEPSGLNIRMRKSAASDGMMSTSPSAPTPKCRSLTIGAIRAGSPTVSSKQLT